MRTKKGDTLYICGFPHCEVRLVIPGSSDYARHPHRDKNGLRCNGLLVSYDLSEIGRREKMAWAYEKEQIIETYRRQRGLPRWMTRDGVKRLMDKNEEDAAKRG